jgi:hypothetical protein
MWGFVGSGLVPVLLTVSRSVASIHKVDLAWSGNNPPYEIYQATNCADVYASFLAVTSSNNYPNITPPAANLVCYSVLATAPGFVNEMQEGRMP